MLFSNKAVANVINENFVAGWENVRNVPKVTIDFGDGRTLKRTLNGNIATYLCTPDGRVFDIIPGLYDAPTYMARLEEGLRFYRAARDLPDLKRAVVAYHRARASGQPSLREVEIRAAFSKGIVEQPIKRALNRWVATDRSIEPIAKIEKQPEMRFAISKSRVEAPVKKALKMDTGKLRVESPVKESMKIDRTPSKPAKEDTLKKDTRNNETIRMAGVRALMIEKPLATPGSLTRRVYKEILHTDLDDPYLGLAPMVLGGESGRN